MQGYAQIQFQVGEWAVKNFGRNETPFLRTRLNGETGCEEVQLDGLAPLMGIVEELGELELAIEDSDGQGACDALGDMAVYLCDYLCREGCAWPSRTALSAEEKYDAETGVLIHLGQLYHAHLKRFQRIRGMEDIKVFEEYRTAALRRFVWHLELLARETVDTSLLTLLNMTWNNIVKKRDWKDDAVNGGGHTHEGVR